MRFTLLSGPADGPVEEDRLLGLYSYPESGWPTLRANMIATIDGAAATGGRSGGLGGPGDRAVFGALRELADVIVVGAGTARTENYGGARLSAVARERRTRRGQAEVPPIALVTRSGELPRALPVLTGSEVTPLVLTCAAAAAGVRARFGRGVEVLDCSGADAGEVDLGVLLRRLAERGLSRMLTEGGPSLLGAFIGAGLLDEMCLTTAPLLAGGSALRVATGTTDVLTRMRRTHLLGDDEGYLYTRYIRG